MNTYQVKTFEAQDPEGKHAGEFVDPDGYDLNDWIQSLVEEGYTLKSTQPVAWGSSLYVLVTMELGETDDVEGEIE